MRANILLDTIFRLEGFNVIAAHSYRGTLAMKCKWLVIFTSTIQKPLSDIKWYINYSTPNTLTVRSVLVASTRYDLPTFEAAFEAQVCDHFINPLQLLRGGPTISQPLHGGAEGPVLAQQQQHHQPYYYNYQQQQHQNPQKNMAKWDNLNREEPSAPIKAIKQEALKPEIL